MELAGTRVKRAPAARSKSTLPAIISGELTRTLFARARFVHGERSSSDFFAVERAHCRIGFSRVAHCDERESAGLARHAIHHQRDFGDFAVFFKKILKIIFGGLKGEISYIQFHVI